MRPSASSDEITSTMPLRSSTPPSLFGRVTHGMSSTLAGGYSRPSLGTASPVALDTAVVSIAGLRAVEEAVEHLRVQAAALGLLGRQAVVAPDRLGRRLAEVRQPLVAAPGRDHREAAGARPVDQVADQRRLVAEGEPVDDAGLGCASARSSGPQKASASTVTLTTCLPCANAARQWSTAAIGCPVHSTTMSIAGCATSACQSSPTCVVAVLQRAASSDAADVRSAFQPTRARLRRAAAGDEVGDADEMDARRARHLREVHRAELAGADQADADRLAVGGALLELGVEAHARLPRSKPSVEVHECARRHAVASTAARPGTSRSRQSSGRHSIGVKSRCAMYSGRLKRRMWLQTAHRLRYTLTRFHGRQVAARRVHQARMEQDHRAGRALAARRCRRACRRRARPAARSARGRWSTADSWSSSGRACASITPAGGCPG